jgi:hypothetical protein
MVVVIAIASAAWWAWRFISLELTAVYAEGFRKAGMPEGVRPLPLVAVAVDAAIGLPLVAQSPSIA